MRKILRLSAFLAIAAACTQSGTVVSQTTYLNPTYVGPKVAVLCVESNIDVGSFNLVHRYGWYDLDDLAPGCHVVYPGEYTVTFNPAVGYKGVPPAVENLDIEEGNWYTFTGVYTKG